MITRRRRRGSGLLAALAIAVALLAIVCDSRVARADDAIPRGPRIGVLPGIGVGMASLTNAPAPLPGLIGFSVSQVELVGELPRAGLFARGLFLSSGEGGRWTAPGIALGATYRFFGDGETSWSLVGRGGLLYERWHASTAGCSIPFFIPENCKSFSPPPPSGVLVHEAPTISATVSTAGLLAGLRLELPVSPVFMAVGGELGALADLSGSSPGAVLQAQLTFTISLRNHQSDDDASPARIAPAEYNPHNR